MNTLHQILNNAGYQLRIINALLDFSHAEIEEPDLTLIPCGFGTTDGLGA